MRLTWWGRLGITFLAVGLAGSGLGVRAADAAESCGVPEGRFCAEYFPNLTLSGEPTVTRLEDAIDHDWAFEGPEGLGTGNYFSARWSGRIDFGDGGYFDVLARPDDGVRVWIGGSLAIDSWQTGSARDLRRILWLEGVQEIVVEYFESEGYASVQVAWPPCGDGCDRPLYRHDVSFPGYGWGHPLAYREDGTLLVVQSGRIHSFDPSGAHVSTIEGLPSDITDLFVASNGDLVIGTWSGSVMRFAPDGERLSEFQVDGDGRVVALAEDLDGSVFVGLGYAFVIERYSADGVLQATLDVPPNPYGYPYTEGLVVLPSGDLVAAFYYNGVFRYADDGSYTKFIDDWLVQDLAIDREGNVVTASGYYEWWVSRYTPEGEWLDHLVYGDRWVWEVAMGPTGDVALGHRDGVGIHGDALAPVVRFQPRPYANGWLREDSEILVDVEDLYYASGAVPHDPIVPAEEGRGVAIEATGCDALGNCATRDTRIDVDMSAAVSAVTTPDGAVLPQVQGLMSVPVRGRTTDPFSGVEAVEVAFVPLAGGEPYTAYAQLGCDVDRTSCDWTAYPPTAPGVYEVRVSSTDRTAHVEEPFAAITVTIV